MTISFIKQPQDVLDYDVDLAKWFKSDATDYITLVSLTIESAQEPSPTLVAGPDAHSDYELVGSPALAFKAWLGGGTENVDYKITFLVTTFKGRKKEVEMKIKVRDR